MLKGCRIRSIPPRARRSDLVYVSAVSDPHHDPEHLVVDHFVENAVVADAHPPRVVIAGEVADPMRAGFALEFGDPGEHPSTDLRIEFA